MAKVRVKELTENTISVSLLLEARLFVKVATNPNPKTAIFKMKIDPAPGPDPAFY